MLADCSSAARLAFSCLVCMHVSGNIEKLASRKFRKAKPCLRFIFLLCQKFKALSSSQTSAGLGIYRNNQVKEQANLKAPSNTVDKSKDRIIIAFGGGSDGPFKGLQGLEGLQGLGGGSDEGGSLEALQRRLQGLKGTSRV